MASVTLLSLLLLVSAASGEDPIPGRHPYDRYRGGSVTVTPKGRNSDGTYEVEICDKQTTYFGSQNNYTCYYGDCGSVVQRTRSFVAEGYRLTYWCDYQMVTRQKLNSSRPFAIRYPSSYDQSQAYWTYDRADYLPPIQMMAHIDMGTRSDTGESNRPPVTAVLSVLRIPRNCPRTFNLTVFDPDGDQVRCRIPTDRNSSECGLCGLQPGFSLDQNSCTLKYTPIRKSAFYPIELMVEDFPNRDIILSYSDGSFTSKKPLEVINPYSTTIFPASTTEGPTEWTTTIAPETNTAAWNTTNTTTTSAWNTTNTTTTSAENTTDVPTTSAWNTTNTTTTSAENTTDVPTTSAWNTTDVPTTPAWNTTDVPTTSAVTTTAPPTPAATTVPYPTWVAPLSKLPLQFMVDVTWYDIPSCTEGDYIPIFLTPTPSNGAALPAFVNHPLEIKVRTSAQYTMISDLYVTGPSRISRKRISSEEYIITWTPSENEADDYIPICFMSEAFSFSIYYYFYYYPFQSELRCVTAVVQYQEAEVTCTESTMTVAVEKNYLIRHNENKLHLNSYTDYSCDLRRLSNSTHLVAVMPLNSCGTTAEENDSNITLRNTITSSDSRQVISRDNDVEIAFACVYPRRANLTLGYKHNNPYAFTEKGFGSFTFQFEFFKSQRFIHQVNASSYPVDVDLKEMIFMQIEAATPMANTELFVESCRATPYDIPNYSISYTLIENGCVKDRTVQIYPSSGSQFRFGMEAFEFIGAYPEVYITCNFLVCLTDDPGTRCSQGCIESHHLHKREVAAQTSIHAISQGPLYLVRSSDSQASGLSLSLGTNLIFIVGCLLVCGVVIYRSRWFRANNSCQRLTQTEDREAALIH